jgi:hypothetical protein
MTRAVAGVTTVAFVDSVVVVMGDAMHRMHTTRSTRSTRTDRTMRTLRTPRRLRILKLRGGVFCYYYTDLRL